MKIARRTKKDKEDLKVSFKQLRVLLQFYKGNRQGPEEVVKELVDELIKELGNTVSEQLVSDLEAKLAEYQEQIFKDAMEGV
jgi:hypothetical protein